ncbi:hypothetical protein ACFLT7_04655 [candidate division KSB1 bacterium]
MEDEERQAWVQQFSVRYIMPVIKRFPELQDWQPADIIKLVAFISNLATLRVMEDYKRWGDEYLVNLSDSIRGWEDSEIAREFLKDIVRDMAGTDGEEIAGDAE